MEHDQRKTYTAWELCGDWWWTDKYRAVIVGGRAEYWEAFSDGVMKMVRLDRIGQNNGLHTIHRYVKPDTLMRLVPQRHGDDDMSDEEMQRLTPEREAEIRDWAIVQPVMKETIGGVVVAHIRYDELQELRCQRNELLAEVDGLRGDLAAEQQRGSDVSMQWSTELEKTRAECKVLEESLSSLAETNYKLAHSFASDKVDALKAERDELLASLGEIYEQVDYWAGEDTVYDDDYPLRKVFERVAAISAKAGIPILEKKLLECDEDDREEYEYLLNLAKKRAGIKEDVE